MHLQISRYLSRSGILPRLLQAIFSHLQPSNLNIPIALISRLLMTSDSFVDQFAITVAKSKVCVFFFKVHVHRIIIFNPYNSYKDLNNKTIHLHYHNLNITLTSFSTISLTISFIISLTISLIISLTELLNRLKHSFPPVLS